MTSTLLEVKLSSNTHSGNAKVDALQLLHQLHPDGRNADASPAHVGVEEEQEGLLATALCHVVVVLTATGGNQKLFQRKKGPS